MKRKQTVGFSSHLHSLSTCSLTHHSDKIAANCVTRVPLCFKSFRYIQVKKVGKPNFNFPWGGGVSFANNYHGSHIMSDSKSLCATTSLVHYLCLDISRINVDLLEDTSDYLYHLNCDMLPAKLLLALIYSVNNTRSVFTVRI